MPRRLTARQLNRATLARQSLLERRTASVEAAVAALCGLQAQSPASPYLALWNRLAGFDPAHLDRAYVDQRVVKATLMRMTQHAVTAADYPAFHLAMAHDMRRSRVFDRRFTDGGIAAEEADALIPNLVARAASAHGNAEFEAIIDAYGLPGKHVWFALRRYAPFWQAPTGGPWSFNDRPAYVAASGEPFAGERDAALAILLRRYLQAFGPASTADFNQFTMLPQPAIKVAITALGDELVVCEGPDGKPLYDVRGSWLPPADAPAPPRLLPMWDQILLAYRDRSRVTPERYRTVVNRINGDTLPAVLVDGLVAGVWRPVPDASSGIEITAFEGFNKRTWAALEAEAHGLVAFLADRQPDVYRRYAHWWAKLPSKEVRVL